MAIRLLAASERRAAPWKNGGGVTREIAVAPEGASLDAFDWRVSTAEVASAGPFSRFEGVDRILTVLTGELELSFPGEPTLALTAGSEPFAFAGERDCAGAPRGGVVTNLNVTVRRGSVRAEVRRVRGDAPLTARGEALLVVTLEAGMIGGQRLAPFDALLVDGGETLRPEGGVQMLVLDLYRM
jgi:uncharacterized protein